MTQSTAAADIAPLQNPVNDAADVASSLQKLGFEDQMIPPLGSCSTIFHGPLCTGETLMPLLAQNSGGFLWFVRKLVAAS
jgi:hypothetical protein